jgi:hypothetical protein
MHICLANKKVILFDLFHTLTALESTWGDNRPLTYQLLGVEKEAWNYQLLQNSPDRLTGRKTDPFEIVAEMARNIDPGIDACKENRLNATPSVVISNNSDSGALERARLEGIPCYLDFS